MCNCTAIVAVKISHNSNVVRAYSSQSVYIRGLQTFLLEGHTSGYTTVWGLDILPMTFVSGYVKFWQISKFFLNIFFIIDKTASRAGWNAFTGWIGLAGRSLETPGLHELQATAVLNDENKLLYFSDHKVYLKSSSFFKNRKCA